MAYCDDPEPTPTPIQIIVGASNTTLYFRSDTVTVNNQTGYAMTVENKLSSAEISDTATGDQNVTYAVRISILDIKGEETQLSDDYEECETLTSDTQGFQNVTWTPSETALQLGADALLVRVYLSFDNGEYTLKGTWVTNQLMSDTLESQTWTIFLYTNKTTDTDTATYFKFSSSTTNSRIINIGLNEPLPQEVALSLGLEGDLIGMFLYPFIAVAGPVFYGCGLLFLVVLYYLRFKSWGPVLVMMLCFGGSGLLGFLIPNIAYRFIYLVAVFVLAGFVYRLWH